MRGPGLPRARRAHGSRWNGRGAVHAHVTAPMGRMVNLRTKQARLQAYQRPAVGYGDKWPGTLHAQHTHEGDPIMAWNLTADFIETCSCNMLCPCWYGVR